MPSSAEPVRSQPSGRPHLDVDRVRCSGHGICAQLLPGQVRLDEWGYPIVVDAHVDPSAGARAVRLCPALALRVGP